MVLSQQKGTQKTEYHPSLPTQKCSKEAGCRTENTGVTIDANWRWVHEVQGYANCYSGN